MDSLIIIIVLRLIHIGFGLFLVGGTLVVAFFLFPAVRRAGPSGGQFLGQLMPRLSLALTVAGILTILSGFWLYQDLYAALPWDTFGPQIVFGVGGAFAVVAAIAGLSIGPRTSKRLGVLGATLASQGTPPTAGQQAERGLLFNRLNNLVLFNSTMMLLAVACMAAGRFV